MPLTRDQLQREAVDALFLHRNIIVEWGTGVGKSRVAVECIDAFIRKGYTRVLLLVAEDAHKTNWRNEFIEAEGEEGGYIYDSVTVECYASFPKYRESEWDLIVADEAHHMRSDLRTEVLSSIKTSYFLCLSATMSCSGDGESMLRAMRERFGDFYTLKFGIQDAIDNNILGEPSIIVHVLSIDDLTQKQIIEESWGPKAKRVDIACTYADYNEYADKGVYPAVNLKIECTPKEAYTYYTDLIDRRKFQWRSARQKAGLKDGEDDTDYTARFLTQMKLAGSQRKICLGRCKTLFARWLIKEMKQKRFICFCADVEQAVELGGERAIHSGNKSSDKVIEDFNEGKISSIFAIKMIQEGQNLSGIESGIIVQLDGKDRQFVQKLGRVFRAKKPEQHIIVVDGTKDTDYFNTAMADIKKKYIRTIYYGRLRERLL